MSEEKDIRVFVRHSLWIESVAGTSPAGDRLFKGESHAIFPQECIQGGKSVFVFDKPEDAQRAAVALALYIKTSRPKKRGKS